MGGKTFTFTRSSKTRAIAFFFLSPPSRSPSLPFPSSVFPFRVGGVGECVCGSGRECVWEWESVCVGVGESVGVIVSVDVGVIVSVSVIVSGVD